MQLLSELMLSSMKPASVVCRIILQDSRLLIRAIPDRPATTLTVRMILMFFVHQCALSVLWHKAIGKQNQAVGDTGIMHRHCLPCQVITESLFGVLTGIC